DAAFDASADAEPLSCPKTCASIADCAPWAALCEGLGDASVFGCQPCRGPNDGKLCDKTFCGYAYAPRFREDGTVYGECETASGGCRCFGVAPDGGRSGYRDDGGPSCH